MMALNGLSGRSIVVFFVLFSIVESFVKNVNTAQYFKSSSVLSYNNIIQNCQSNSILHSSNPRDDSEESNSNSNKNKKPVEVEAAISDVMELLAKRSGIVLNVPDTGDNLEILTGKYQQILQDMKKSTTLTDIEKSLFYSEAKLTLNNFNGGQKAVKLPKYDTSSPKTKIYSESAAPYVCVYGTGKIGQKMKSTFKELGSAVNVKYLDVDKLLGITESELKFIVRNARTVILACDNDVSGIKRGWLDPEPSFTSITGNGLKRLLNAVLNENLASRSTVNDSTSSPVKVVALCKGMKDSKSLGSLLGGDTFDLENEVILLCNQRNFQYAIVKVGNVIDDTVSAASSSNVIDIPEGNTLKRLKETYFSKLNNNNNKAVSSSTTSPPSIRVAEAVQAQILNRPILLSLSRVDVTESTRVSVAVETMLRVGNYPLLNTTFAILSTPATKNIVPTPADYDDELSKLIGPELYRIPLKYASVPQTILKLSRMLSKLQEPGNNSGLITPIAVEKYDNAVRILFKPKESSYLSSRDEKSFITSTAAGVTNNIDDTSSSSSITKGGYMSPEQEAKYEKEEALKQQQLQKQQSLAAAAKSNLKLEGGLEILIDEVPYKRLRIRRCNMGPKTVVKEESEALILKMILSSIQTLENDYRILLDTDISTAVMS